MSCSHSRSGRFTWDSGRWKKIHGAIRMSDMPLFWGGVIHMHPKPHVMPQEVPNLYMLSAHKAGRVTRHYITERDSAHRGPYSRLYEHCKVMVAQTDVWVREPD